MSKRILLTGATGFVGRQIVKALNGKTNKLKLIVRKDSEKEAKKLCKDAEIIITNDLFLEKTEWWEKQCEDIDILIHAAWYAEPGKYLYSDKNLDCLIGTLEMTRGILKSKVNKIVGIGTCFEYDLKSGVLSTQTPLNPLTPYAAAKASVYTTS